MPSLHSDIDKMDAIETRWRIFGLCAQWCGVCREYEALFTQIQKVYPNADFVWLDIESPQISDALADLDIETFPWIMAGFGKELIFNGPVLPQSHVLERMLRAWLNEPDSRNLSAVQDADGLQAFLALQALSIKI